MANNILITGSSSGFGRLTAELLLSKGHTVVATMRDPQGKNQGPAEELEKAGAHIVHLDVTDTESVEEGVEAAVHATGGLDVVVNNAGVGAVGLQESFTAEDWQRLFEVNVFGVQRVNRAAIPHMRERGTGLIVFVTSLLGRFCLPFYGPYNASKWAMEAMAENYRVELSGFGVDVSIVEPGGFPTAFQESLLTPGDPSRADGYGEFAAFPKTMRANFEETLAAHPEQDPRNVADAVVGVIETPAGKRPFRTVVDKLGMGDPIAGYNDQLDQLTTGIFNAFGIGNLLTLKV